MTQTISLSRAARLVGVTRSELQKKIREGELSSFDGSVTLDDLLATYPDAQLEDNTEYSRVTRIKERAFGKRVFERAMPDVEVLAARITEMGRELSNAQTRATHFNILLDRLQKRLNEIEKQCAKENKNVMSELKSWLKQEISAAAEPDYLNPLAVRDNLLRVMSAHVKLLPSGHDFFVDGNDTLLEAALRAGVPLNYGCSGGNCGLCKARVVSGQIKKVRHHDYVIPEAERAQGYALMCSNTAVTDIEIEAAVAGGVQDIPFQQITTKVKSIEMLTLDIALLHLQTPRTSRLRFLAGQSLTVRLGQSLSAELPIASCPCEDRNLLFHVRRLPGNLFSDYLFNRLRKNDAVDIEGPLGEFILHENSTRPLCFVAFDTGFAPVKSLIEHAMSLDTGEAISLYWIGSDDDSIYLRNAGRAWADALDNFHFSAIVTGYDLRTLSGRRAETLQGTLRAIVEDHPQVLECDIYIAGPDAAAEVAELFFLALGLPGARVFSNCRPGTPEK
jgi:CDP-4-dehydro-6-deoxyglucose reductase, E3